MPPFLQRQKCKALVSPHQSQAASLICNASETLQNDPEVPRNAPVLMHYQYSSKIPNPVSHNSLATTFSDRGTGVLSRVSASAICRN